MRQTGLRSLNAGSSYGLYSSPLGRLGFLRLFLLKKVGLDSLKVDGTHVENYIYSTQMSKFIQIKAKISLWGEKKTNKKSVEIARNFFYFC